jgi:hypothetical protein
MRTPRLSPYRPARQQLWRIKPDAGYGPAGYRGLREDRPGQGAQALACHPAGGASIHTGTVRAYDVIRMLQRDGHPTPPRSARRSPATGGSSRACTC